jgi:integrase
VTLRKLLGDRDKGLAPVTDMRKLHYRDLRQALLDNYIEKGNKSLAVQCDGEGTIGGLKQLDDFFGFGPDNPGPPVTQITTNTSREFARKRQAEGVGAAWINRSLACLRRMLRIAHEDGKIQTVPKIRLLKEPPARQGFLELEKFDELLGLLPTYLKPLIIFLYYCGVRVGEALQITWEQVNLDVRLIRLEDDQTKNAEARIVPLPSQLVDMLRQISPKAGKVFDGTNLRNEWQMACDRCSLGKRETIKPEDGYVWYKYSLLLIHDLRRSAVRNLVNAGVPERVAMKISGHKTRAVFHRYHIASTDDVTNAMRRVELNGNGNGRERIKGRLREKSSRSVRQLAVSNSN